MKIALATLDSVTVSQHFGKTPFFLIAETDGENYTIIEKRKNNPACDCGEHNHELMAKSIEIISDCDVVIALKIGNFVKVALDRKNIQSLEKGGLISDILDDYIKYLQRKNKINFTTKIPLNKSENHPCFNDKAHGKYGRIHLPVSAKCNIKCRFCTRDINSEQLRPGVATTILRTENVAETMRKALELCPEISVAGIAGIGDALADNKAVETFEILNKNFPELQKCLSTNGLGLPEYVFELAELGLKYITVTVNAVNADILEKIVEYVEVDGKKIYGKKAAEILIKNQLDGIRKAFLLGMEVKVNTVLIPGINDEHIGEIAQTVKELGVARYNIMPLIPNGEFENYPVPDCKMLNKVRSEAEKYLPVFKKCSHCRADACGIPGKNEFSKILYESTNNFRCLNNCGG
jgi:nitrogen fixation protein NifB